MVAKNVLSTNFERRLRLVFDAAAPLPTGLELESDTFKHEFGLRREVNTQIHA